MKRFWRVARGAWRVACGGERGAQVGIKHRVVAFLRAGYPTGAPEVGYGPVLALLPRRVTDDEVTAIVRRLKATGSMDSADVGDHRGHRLDADKHKT